jgi:hypothetical protein
LGFIFEVSDVTVWEPSLNVGRLFLTSVRQLERQVNMPSGLVEVMSDTIEVDPRLLQEFVQALLDSTAFQNESLLILLHGPLVHLIALLSSVKPSVQLSNVPETWTEEAIVLARRRFRANVATDEDFTEQKQ